MHFFHRNTTKVLFFDTYKPKRTRTTAILRCPRHVQNLQHLRYCHTPLTLLGTPASPPFPVQAYVYHHKEASSLLNLWPPAPVPHSLGWPSLRSVFAGWPPRDLVDQDGSTRRMSTIWPNPTSAGRLVAHGWKGKRKRKAWTVGGGGGVAIWCYCYQVYIA